MPYDDSKNQRPWESGLPRSSSPGGKPVFSLPHFTPKPKPPVAPPPSSDEKDSLVGKSVSAYDLAKKFKSLPVRKEIAQKIGIADPYSKDVDSVIENMMSNLQQFGPVIDPDEVRSMVTPDKILETYLAKQRRSQEEVKDNIISSDELKQRKKSAAGWSVLGKWFGWDK
jgi:hypothetical protein